MGKEITDEECVEKTNLTTDQLFNGIIKKLWPRIKMKEVFHYNNFLKPLNDKTESNKLISGINTNQCFMLV